MAINLNRIDSYTPGGGEFNFMFASWIANLIDTLNEVILTVEDRLNQTSAPSYTTAEITALATTAPNGTFWYDTSTNQLKAKVNNVVVVLA